MTDTCVSPLFLHLWAETRTRQHVSVAQVAPARLRTFAVSPKQLETLYSSVLLVLRQLSIRSHSFGTFREDEERWNVANNKSLICHMVPRCLLTSPSQDLALCRVPTPYKNYHYLP